MIALGEIQRIVGLQQAGGDAQHLGEGFGGLARAHRGARQDQVGDQAALLEAPCHVLRFAVALAAQRPLEVAHVGILLGVGVADQRQALRVC